MSSFNPNVGKSALRFLPQFSLTQMAEMAPLQSGQQLGPPLGIGEVARLIGCSPWTVRQTLIPRGLPHFRFNPFGRLVFYQDQVIRWIEGQQADQRQPTWRFNARKRR